MRLEEVIGHRIRERREVLGLTQEQVGQRIGETLDKPWPRQAVSAAEKGDRAFTAVELVAIALALNSTVSWLLTPLAGGSGVQMPSGDTVDDSKLVSAVLPQLTEEEGGIEDMREALIRLASRIMDNARMFDRLMDDVRILHGQLMRRRGIPIRMDRIGRERDITGMDPATLIRDTWIESGDEDPGSSSER